MFFTVIPVIRPPDRRPLSHYKPSQNSSTKLYCISQGLHKWYFMEDNLINPKRCLRHACDICHVGKQNNEIFLHYNRFHFPEEINCIVSPSDMAYVSGRPATIHFPQYDTYPNTVVPIRYMIRCVT